MPHAHVSPRRSSQARTHAGVRPQPDTPGDRVCAVEPAVPYVRVTRDKTEIKSLRGTSEVRMTAPKGTVLEVIYIEGDRYNHRDSNWYWVLLPRDPWATRPAGWIRGDAVEHVPPPQPAAAAQASRRRCRR